jgi:SAM-dependent methyltransferase
MEERIVLGEPSWTNHSAHHVARYLVAAEYVVGRRVLDAGCGIGYGTALLKAAGAAEVAGVDIDSESLALAEKQFGGDAITFLQDDCQELGKLSGPFDVICSFENIEHLPHPERFLRRAGQLLADGGVLLISTPDRLIMRPFVDGRPRNQYHFHEWYRDEFRQLLTAAFRRVDMRAQVESVAYGSRQQAVEALRQGLLWSNPLLMFLWRKWPLMHKADRPWKRLAGLAAPTIADYPVVPLAVAPIHGSPWCHFAICRQPEPTCRTDCPSVRQNSQHVQ